MGHCLVKPILCSWTTRFHIKFQWFWWSSEDSRMADDWKHSKIPSCSNQSTVWFSGEIVLVFASNTTAVSFETVKIKWFRFVYAISVIHCYSEIRCFKQSYSEIQCFKQSYSAIQCFKQSYSVNYKKSND